MGELPTPAVSRPVPTWVFVRAIRDHGPRHAALRGLLHALAAFANREGCAWPSVRTLADAACLSTNTTTKLARRAAAEGWLTLVVERAKGKAWRRHAYRLTVPDTVDLTDIEAKLAGQDEGRVQGVSQLVRHQEVTCLKGQAQVSQKAGSGVSITPASCLTAGATEVLEAIEVSLEGSADALRLGTDALTDEGKERITQLAEQQQSVGTPLQQLVAYGIREALSDVPLDVAIRRIPLERRVQGWEPAVHDGFRLALQRFTRPTVRGRAA